MPIAIYWIVFFLIPFILLSCQNFFPEPQHWGNSAYWRAFFHAYDRFSRYKPGDAPRDHVARRQFMDETRGGRPITCRAII